MQNARDNPIAAAAAAAAVSGAPPSTQTNAENLLDFDMDGATPASAQKAPTAGLSGLEGLAGTPQRVESPAVQSPTMGGPNAHNNLDDLMGVFGGDGPATNNGMADLMNGFGGMSTGDLSQPAPASEQLPGQGDALKKPNEDILGLF